MYDLQKASFWKRISAYLFDFILLGILAVGVAWLLSSVLGYDTQIQKMNDFYTYYEEEYGIKIDITQEEFEKLTEDELKHREEVDKIIRADEDLQSCYSMVISLTLVIVTFGLLIAFLVMDFFVPLLFGNGQTLGKKIFSLGVMQETGVKISTISLFVRAVFGKFTIETMLPVLLVLLLYFGAGGLFCIVILLILLVFQIGILIATDTNSAIHDKLSSTVVVDISSQMIFENNEALLAYKKRVAQEKAEKSGYAD